MLRSADLLKPFCVTDGSKFRLDRVEELHAVMGRRKVTCNPEEA